MSHYESDLHICGRAVNESQRTATSMRNIIRLARLFLLLLRVAYGVPCAMQHCYKPLMLTLEETTLLRHLLSWGIREEMRPGTWSCPSYMCICIMYLIIIMTRIEPVVVLGCGYSSSARA